jgi:uncharacterized protein
VDWHPWGEEPFQVAQATNRPIFLSIGFAACHWCHVMERESFQDASVAEILNREFVPVKVDRQEHPDVDSAYMQAVQQMTGAGGWPLTVFLTPEGLPFLGGTYFPPERRDGLPGFRELLEAVADGWKNQREQVMQEVKGLRSHLRSLVAPVHTTQVQLPWDEAMAAWKEAFDRREGGLRQVPKFPNPGLIEAWLTCGLGGDGEALQMALLTLEKMAHGAIFDQVGGGFHRYAVDALWGDPHFEKMLGDNALLARLYQLAGEATGRDDLLRVARETADWMEREMALPGGGFAAALDADSAGEEGRYYLWTRGEAEQLLSPELVGSCQVGDEPQPLRGPLLPEVRRQLLEARRNREAPARDEQLLIEWNGYALSLMAMMHRLKPAEALAQRVKALCGAKLCRLIAGDRLVGAPLAQDLGAWLEGLIDLYQATWDPSYVNWALQLAEGLSELRPNRLLFVAPSLAEEGSSPSALSLLVRGLARLGHLVQRPALVQAAERLLRRHAGVLTPQNAPLYPYLLLAASWVKRPVTLVQLSGPREEVQPFLQVAQRHRLGQCLVRYQPADALQVVVCSGFRCTSQPVTVEALEAFLNRQSVKGDVECNA